MLRDPGGTAISEAIRAILLDKAHGAMDPVTELLLYQAARSQMTAQSIRPALESGQIVICDRFTDSTTAYQGHGRGLDSSLIAQANAIGSLGLRPDRTYVLDIPWEESLRRRRGGLADRMESEAEAFYDRIRQGYNHIAKTDPQRVRLLDGCQSPEHLEQIIRDDVLNLVGRIDTNPRIEEGVS